MGPIPLRRGRADRRVVLWLLAVVVEYLAPWHGYWLPGRGRSATSQWTIEGGHMAERCRLFVIIALGESVLVSGATLGDLGPSAGTLAAFATVFAGTLAMWWIYFDRTADAGVDAIAAAEDPGRLARSVYTYLHLPMVAGIIVTAVAGELVIAHPGGHVEAGTAAAILGGPALYLAGNALFTRAVVGRLAPSRLIAMAVLAALIPLALVVTPLLLAVLATCVLVALPLTDARAQATPR